MVQKDIIKKIAEREELTEKQVEEIIKSQGDFTVKSMKEGKSIKLSRYGKLVPIARLRDYREGNMPKPSRRVRIRAKLDTPTSKKLPTYRSIIDPEKLIKAFRVESLVIDDNFCELFLNEEELDLGYSKSFVTPIAYYLKFKPVNDGSYFICGLEGVLNYMREEEFKTKYERIYD